MSCAGYARSGSTPVSTTIISWISAPPRSAMSSRLSVADDRIHFELFEATHAAIDYRYPIALSWLAHRLAR